MGNTISNLKQTRNKDHERSKILKQSDTYGSNSKKQDVQIPDSDPNPDTPIIHIAQTHLVHTPQHIRI